MGRLFIREKGLGTREIVPGVNVVCAIPRLAGGWLLAAYDGLYDFDETGTRRRKGPALVDTRFNDGVCDAHGRFWVGTMSVRGDPGRGELYRVDTEVTKVADNFDVCNGIGFSPDNRWLYIVDTVPRLVYRYAFDLQAGTIGIREPFFQFPSGMGKPDGIAVDAEGNVWCAMWDGACLVRLTPGGKLADKITVPVPRPTSLAFGDHQMLVTTARKGLTDDQLRDFPQSGEPLWLASQVAGTPLSAFAF